MKRRKKDNWPLYWFKWSVVAAICHGAITYVNYNWGFAWWLEFWST